MASLELVTLIAGTRVGVLRQDEQGLVSFSYDAGYAGIPLSRSLPVSNKTYDQRVVRPYLMGLLPDSEQVRRRAVQGWGIRPNNPVAMLAHMGADCPGAVKFCAPEQLRGMMTRRGAYEPISEKEIAERLRQLGTSDEQSWLGDGEHWSLGGNQGKFALAYRNGHWNACKESAATTHIFKDGVRGLKLQALDEFVCMQLAARCGIPSAPVDYQLFDGLPALIVERYDRRVMPDGTVARIPQEDFCQALGVEPTMKYTSDGGPTTRDCVGLLASTREARTNLQLFTRMLFFNYLIGAPDAHAKNYSLLLGLEDDDLLAPTYDVASGLAYEGMRRSGRLAMSIGGENRFGCVGSGAIRRYAALPGLLQNGISYENCKETMRALAEEIPNLLSDIFATWRSTPGIDELRDRLEQPMADSCETTLQLL